MNKHPINPVICANNKYSHNILKFKRSSCIRHIQKYLKSTHLYPNASAYSFGAWPISFAVFKAPGVTLDPLSMHLSGSARERLSTESHQFMELGRFKQYVQILLFLIKHEAGLN